MWFAVYVVSSGSLVSVGTIVADPLPSGLASVSVGESEPSGEWNPATLVFDAVAPVPILSPNDFMARFTFPEECAIRSVAKTDIILATFLARVERARTVSLIHPDTVNGIAYCVAHTGLTQARATEILQ